MYMLFVLTFLFVILDLVSGYLKAVINHEVSSKKLREGLFHKAAYVLLVTLAVVIEKSEGYLIDSTIPVILPCCTYIAITEITSILENIKVINPNILPSAISDIFGQIIEESEETSNDNTNN